MAGIKRRLTPLVRQWFVTCGVFLNMMQISLMIGYPAILLSQLRETRYFAIDESSSSWIASINGCGLFLGLLTIPLLMSRFGRRDISLAAATIMITGWLSVYFATSLWIILAARFFQGMASGFTTCLCSFLIGEYTSPKNRGMFLATIPTAMFVGVLVIHTTGLCLSWRTTALLPVFVGLVDIIIIFNSPESPTFLATKGRYDECKKTFRWLRGNKEDEELNKLLQAPALRISVQSCRSKEITYSVRLMKKFRAILTTLKKKRFYKPIIIMIHLNMINLWSGAAVYDCFAIDIYGAIIGSNVDIVSFIISLDVQCVLSSLLGILIVKKFKRRTVLLFTSLLNIAASSSLASYAYAKINGLLSFDHPFIGMFLGHLHIFSITTGPTSLPNVVDGEIFPVAYKKIGGTISVLFLATIMTLTLNITPFLFLTIGIYGAYFIFALLVGYGLVVTMITLPETKDRTLQDIEEEFGPDQEVDKEMHLLPVTSSNS